MKTPQGAAVRSALRALAPLGLTAAALVSSALQQPLLVGALLAAASLDLLAESLLSREDVAGRRIRAHLPLVAALGFAAGGAALLASASVASALSFASAVAILVAGSARAPMRVLPAALALGLVAGASAGLTWGLDAMAASVLIVMAVVAATWGLIPSWRSRDSARPPEPLPRVCVYFGEDRSRLHQLDQWLPVLSRLAAQTDIGIVTRHRDVLDELRTKSSLPVTYVETGADLVSLYARSADLMLVLYVNNGTLNFQSLAWARARHVHLGHGESDKASSASHHIVAYDAALVAGRAAEDRLTSMLTPSRLPPLIRVGRPQLDLLPPAGIGPCEGRLTCIYAPTWEGEDEANNFTSIDVLGVPIASELLLRADVRFVYKPHPRILTSRTPEVRRAHREVVRRVRDAARRDPTAGHTVWTGDVLAVLGLADVLVTDVSSVPIDHLYLRPDALLALTTRTSTTQLARVSPLSAGAVVITPATVGELGSLGAAPPSPSLEAERKRLRRYYFEVPQDGDSVRLFADAVRSLASSSAAA